MASKLKPVCKFGPKCYRKNQDHIDKFEHGDDEKEPSNEENNPPPVALSTETSRKRKLEEETKKSEQVKVVKASSDEIHKQQLADMTMVERFDLNAVKDDMAGFVKEHHRMDMPDDFYDFLDFCKSIDPKNPKNALSLLNLELCGVYDLVLFGYKLDYRLHSRFFYDPPEFQTVLSVTTTSDDNATRNLLHFGYFRDSPDELPEFVATNDATNGQIGFKGENLFAAVNSYIDELLLEKESTSSSKKQEIKDLKELLIKWLGDNKKTKVYSLDLSKSTKYKAREKRCNCKTFHKAGMCVPIDSNGNGYRPVPESYESQRKMFNNYCLKEDEGGKRVKAAEQIQEIITLIQFANDECDPGMGLEFGLNMFAHGATELHKFIRSTLVVSYSLLERELYAEIIKEHLKNRKLY